LQQTDKGTEITLEHSGFEKEVNLALFNGLNKGWVEKFEKISKLINASQHGTVNA